MAEYVAGNISWKGHYKRLRLLPSQQLVSLPLSACITKGDPVLSRKDGLWVRCRNGEAQVHGPYVDWETVRIGALSLRTAVKEITDRCEHDSYLRLAELHYRGEDIHGRTARIILRAYDPAYPPVVGYVELATPFFVNKARSTILDSAYNDGVFQWSQWDKDTHRTHLHLLVRIARLVVSPEFRGLGVSRLLLRHAFRFAQTRWQVAGIKPIFVEISADMLRYIPFAEKAGMTYVGDTEGNLHRVAKDMGYLIRRFGVDATDTTHFEKSCGICDQQVSRMQASLRVASEEGLSVEELLERLDSLSQSSVLKQFAMFHSIAVLPKPHYMIGLTDEAQRFLTERAAAVAPPPPNHIAALGIEPLTRPLSIRDLTLSYSSRVRRTHATHAVQQAFGISPEGFSSTVIADLSLEISPGEVLLITGPSGSGKSTLLRTIAGIGRDCADLDVSGFVSCPKGADIGLFLPPRSTKSLVELVAPRDLAYGMQILAIAGLSEAYLYLRRFSELSEGQKHRAMLALLLARKHNIWVADDFCTCLDYVTANAVAHSLQKAARAAGATLLVSTPDSSGIVKALNPDRVLVLRSSTEFAIVQPEELRGTLAGRTDTPGPTTELRVRETVLRRVRRGARGIHIAEKNGFIPGQAVRVVGARGESAATIQSIGHYDSTVATRQQALAAGYGSLAEMQKALPAENRGHATSRLCVIHLDPLQVKTSEADTASSG